MIRKAARCASGGRVPPVFNLKFLLLIFRILPFLSMGYYLGSHHTRFKKRDHSRYVLNLIIAMYALGVALLYVNLIP